MMTTAIVLSTYNGEKYIREQLHSILAQTRKPDHVYISDDCSQDDTVKIIEQFIADNKLDNWTVTLNKDNKGWAKNFHDLILSVEESIIFLCDQDDIWYHEKISEMAGIIEGNEFIDLLACGYDALYEGKTRKISKRILKEMQNKGTINKIKMNEKYMDVKRPGCSYAVRKSFCQKVSISWDSSLPHDAMLWRSAVIMGTAYIYDKKLFSWRRYNTSSSSANGTLSNEDNQFVKLYKFNLKNVNSHLLYLNAAYDLISKGVIQVDINTGEILANSKLYEEGILCSLETKNIKKYLNTGKMYWKYIPSFKSFIWNAFVLYKNKITN